MRLAEIVEEAFAGLAPANPANPANGRANARSSSLRIVANGCESISAETLEGGEIRKDSQAFAEPRSRASACDSQDSQHSQGVSSPLRSHGRLGDVLTRLLAWGWPRAEAEAVAEHIARRAAGDDRSTCTECNAFRPGRCTRHKAAGLFSPEVGRDLASVPQRCPAFRRRRD